MTKVKKTRIKPKQGKIAAALKATSNGITGALSEIVTAFIFVAFVMLLVDAGTRLYKEGAFAMVMVVVLALTSRVSGSDTLLGKVRDRIKSL